MARKPLRPVALLGTILIAAAVSMARAEEIEGPPTSNLSGSVRAVGGLALEKSLVLLTPVGAAGSVRSVLTGADGAFLFQEVPRGLYRATAIRDGYRASVSQVSTLVSDTIEFVLSPIGEPKTQPADPSWLLRAPARDILREREAAPSDAEESAREPSQTGSLSGQDGAVGVWAGAASSLPASGAAGALMALRGEIRQSFSDAGDYMRSSPTDPASGVGSQTSLSLGTPIGSGGRWDVAGAKERESLTWRSVADEARESNAERVRVSLEMETGDEGRLDVRAYYDHDALLYQTALLSPTATMGLGGERRSWGYDAGWTGGIGGGASLDVALRYASSVVGSSVEVDPRRSTSARFDALDGDGAEANIVRTSARITKPFGSHRMHVGVRAGVYDARGAPGIIVAPSAAQDPTLYSEFGQGGWTVSVSAAESWSVTAPLSIDYGFDVSRTAYAAGYQRAALVPQAGLTFRPGSGTTIRGIVSYAAVGENLPTHPAAVTVPSVAEKNPLGYRIRVDHSFSHHLSFIADAESRPLYHEPIGARWDQTGPESAGTRLYISDGNAQVEELTLVLRGEEPIWGAWSIGASAGRVGGFVAATVPEQDLLAQAAIGGDVSYRVLHLGSRFSRTGTEIQLEISTLSQTPGELGAGLEYRDRRAGLRVLQGLLVHPGATDWTVMMAYSSYHPETVSSGEDPERSILPLLRTSVTRVSGGVAVRF